VQLRGKKMQPPYAVDWHAPLTPYLSFSYGNSDIGSIKFGDMLAYKFIKKALWSPIYGQYLAMSHEESQMHESRHSLSFYSLSDIKQIGNSYQWDVGLEIHAGYPITDFLWVPTGDTAKQHLLYSSKNQSLKFISIHEREEYSLNSHSYSDVGSYSLFDHLTEKWHNPTCLTISIDGTK
jgi:hypothetical protein